MRLLLHPQCLAPLLIFDFFHGCRSLPADLSDLSACIARWEVVGIAVICISPTCQGMDQVPLIFPTAFVTLFTIFFLTPSWHITCVSASRSNRAAPASACAMRARSCAGSSDCAADARLLLI